MTAWLLLATVGLLVANGFFVGAEFALTAARRTKVESMAEVGDLRARAALASIRELSLMLAGAQLGITMASLALGYLSEPAIAHLIESALEPFGGIPPELLHTISFVIALAIVVFLHMVIGEMAPKNIAIAEPERSALWLAVPFRLFVNVFRPFLYVLNVLSNAGLRLMGIQPRDELEFVASPAQISRLINRSAEEGVLGRFEQRLLTGAIEFTDLDAAAVMVPRTEVKAVPLDITPAALEDLVLKTGHSRFPVYAQDLDNIAGFVHSKDLLRLTDDVYDAPIPRNFVRQMLVVPESHKLYPLLIDMRRQRKHLALVLDEHGGTSGIVTIEDLVEEIVGEIRDEYDDAELGIERLGDNRFVVPGTLRVHEAADALGLHIPPGEYETIAGFLMDKLQRIPKRRDEFDHEGWRLRVRTMHRRRVVQVHVERILPED